MSDIESVDRDPDDQWSRVVADLRAHSEAQRRAWGDIDEALIARYITGEGTAEERNRVEEAAREFPGVRECVQSIQEILVLRSAGTESSRRKWAEGAVPYMAHRMAESVMEVLEQHKLEKDLKGGCSTLLRKRPIEGDR